VDDRAVVDVVDAEGLRAALDARTREIGRPSFAERYVAGREFNLSLIADAGGEPLVLPPAEIDFSQFPPEKLRIVGYAAKWDADSFEYQHTPRSFEFPAADQSLLAELQRLAGACWRLFDLRGFARVDFRVDAAGRPWILEVNVNPCLAPDAGWMAAVERARIPPAEALERVAAAALRP
jgi:D-alanine-D-alanine ligase